jgi:hypothetical protein
VAIAGDERGVLSVGQRDQIIIVGVFATDRGRTLRIRHELAVSTQEAKMSGDDIQLEIAPELLSPQYRLELTEK